jgi:acyl-[acyl-carrier-protein]-phospholipid O-acyltransferase/long-chain-fatty-acid--[acyl-carrier-protein] ligase
MNSNQFYLFKDRRFLPIFLVQFCGCLNDSILKNSLIILITFKLANQLTTPVYILILLANVIFILPFVLFASLAGQVADRHERTTIVKIIKFTEIGIILAAIYGSIIQTWLCFLLAYGSWVFILLFLDQLSIAFCQII